MEQKSKKDNDGTTGLNLSIVGEFPCKKLNGENDDDDDDNDDDNEEELTISRCSSSVASPRKKSRDGDMKNDVVIKSDEMMVLKRVESVMAGIIPSEGKEEEEKEEIGVRSSQLNGSFLGGAVPPVSSRVLVSSSSMGTMNMLGSVSSSTSSSPPAPSPLPMVVDGANDEKKSNGVEDDGEKKMMDVIVVEKNNTMKSNSTRVSLTIPSQTPVPSLTVDNKPSVGKENEEEEEDEDNWKAEHDSALSDVLDLQNAILNFRGEKKLGSVFGSRRRRRNNTRDMRSTDKNENKSDDDENILIPPSIVDAFEDLVYSFLSCEVSPDEKEEEVDDISSSPITPPNTPLTSYGRFGMMHRLSATRRDTWHRWKNEDALAGEKSAGNAEKNTKKKRGGGDGDDRVEGRKRESKRRVLWDRHPIRIVLPHVSFLKVVFDCLAQGYIDEGGESASSSSSSSQKTGSGSPSSPSGNATTSMRFVSLLEGMSDYIMAISNKAIQDQEDYNDSGDDDVGQPGFGPKTSDEFEFVGKTEENEFWKGMSSMSEDSDCDFDENGQMSKTKPNKKLSLSSSVVSSSSLTSVEVNEAASKFRVSLILLAEGALLIRKSRLLDLRLKKDREKRAVSHAIDRMTKPVKIDGFNWDDKALNQRSTLAALQLKKLKKKEKVDGDESNEKIPLISLRNDKDLESRLKKLVPYSNKPLPEPTIRKPTAITKAFREWTRNIDTILVDLSEPSATAAALTIRTSNTTTNTLSISSTDPNNTETTTHKSKKSKKSNTKNEAVTYMLLNTIPEILSIGTLEAAESTGAILAGFVRRKRRTVRSFSSKNINKGETKDSALNDSLWLEYCVFILGKIEKLLKISGVSPYLSKDTSSLWVTVGFVALLVVSLSRLLFGTSILIPGFLGALVLFLGLSPYLSVRCHRYRRLLAARRRNMRHPFEFFPPLPPDSNYLPRHSLKNAIISTILNPPPPGAADKQRDDGITNNNSKKKAIDQTIITWGPLGSGKTTLVSMAVRNPAMKIRFPDGIIWISLHSTYSVSHNSITNSTMSKMTFANLINLYDRICNQLSAVSSSRSLVRAASSFDTRRYYIRPEDDHQNQQQHQQHGTDSEDLMQDLRREFFSRLDLASRRVLLVLDGMEDPDNDLVWFRCPQDVIEAKELAASKAKAKLQSQPKGSSHTLYSRKEPSNPFQILVTTTKRPTTKESSMRLLGVGSPNEREAMSLFQNELKLQQQTYTQTQHPQHLPDSLTKSVIDTCTRSPLALLFVARAISKVNASNDDLSNWWEKLTSQAPSIPDNDDDINYRTYLFVNFCVSELLSRKKTDADGVEDVLKLCFVAFVTLFTDRSHLSPSSSSSSSLDDPVDDDNTIPEPYIPAKIATIFWDELLSSREVSLDQLTRLERHLLRAKKDNLYSNEGVGRRRSSTDIFKSNKNKNSNKRIISKSIFVADRLVSLGLLSVVYSHERVGRGWKRMVCGYTVEGDVLRRIGMALAKKYSLHDSDDMGVVTRVQTQSVALVHGFQEYLSLSSRAKASEVNGFIMRNIVQYMILGNMLDTALSLLTSESFIKNRFRLMGCPLSCALRQIADAELLIRSLQRINSETTLVSGKKIHKAFARTSVTLSFERVADHLIKISRRYDTAEAVKAAVGLYSLGDALLRQSWSNEAFTLFLESWSVFSVLSTFDIQLQDCVHRVMARAIHNLGRVYFDKNDLAEANRSFAESLQCCPPTSLGNRSHRIRTLHCIGETHFANGEPNSALEAYNDALVAVKSAFGREHTDYATLLHKMGTVHMDAKQAGKAKDMFSEALQLRKSLFGEYSASAAETLHWLGCSHRELGDMDLSTETFISAIYTWKRVLLVDDSVQAQYASSVHSLGQLYHKQGLLEDALQSYIDASQVQQSFLGMDHVDTAQTLQDISVVYCDMGDQEQAMKAYIVALRARMGPGKRHSLRYPQNTRLSIGEEGDAAKAFGNALWMSGAFHVTAPSVESVQERCVVLFGEKVRSLPCSSARIFSCLSLTVDHMIRNEKIPRGKNKSGQKDSTEVDNSSLMEWTKPMMPLMNSIVDAEIAVMDTSRPGGLEDGDEGENSPRKKKVCFCSYDFTAIASPVDMTIGSNSELECIISKLETVLEEVDSLTFSSAYEVSDEGSVASSGNMLINNSEITKMLLVLHAMASPAEGEDLRGVCAESMPDCFSWPATRFIRAAETYRAEFESFLALGDSKSNEPRSAASAMSPLRARLSTHVGFAVRYHLRFLLDPIPLSYTVPSERHPFKDFSSCRARTFEIVAMSPPQGVNKKRESKNGFNPAPIWETPLSHVFNLALQRIYSFFESQEEIRASFVASKGCPPALSLSQASMRCLEGRAKDRTLSDVDMEEILGDIRLAHTCLSAARASKFILSLLKWPGVDIAIENAGGWERIESFSRIITRFNLGASYPEEAHFSLLHDMGEFVARLKTQRPEMILFARASQKVLQDMWRRFKRGAIQRRRRHTNDSRVRDVLFESSETAVFPQLTIPDSDGFKV